MEYTPIDGERHFYAHQELEQIESHTADLRRQVMIDTSYRMVLEEVRSQREILDTLEATGFPAGASYEMYVTVDYVKLPMITRGEHRRAYCVQLAPLDEIGDRRFGKEKLKIYVPAGKKLHEDDDEVFYAMEYAAEVVFEDVDESGNATLYWIRDVSSETGNPTGRHTEITEFTDEHTTGKFKLNTDEDDPGKYLQQILTGNIANQTSDRLLRLMKRWRITPQAESAFGEEPVTTYFE